ncbi:putative ubiquitin-conjugating enzyme E2 24 [Porphyridium purpureum]|uniref:Putative ubiquitin-conjugating enzyme E2 24 n=1 Tax=Porphyridium purpureum TaxID=35688 RepID=A0A5J4YPJ1_PORPP|nr:putative ubiquitin-conjugating enzyme E2 24 [Porphyridium purpureum]|eukprot:POR4651..scf296_7
MNASTNAAGGAQTRAQVTPFLPGDVVLHNVTGLCGIVNAVGGRPDLDVFFEDDDEDSGSDYSDSHDEEEEDLRYPQQPRASASAPSGVRQTLTSLFRTVADHLQRSRHDAQPPGGVATAAPAAQADANALMHIGDSVFGSLQTGEISLHDRDSAEDMIVQVDEISLLGRTFVPGDLVVRGSSDAGKPAESGLVLDETLQFLVAFGWHKHSGRPFSSAWVDARVVTGLSGHGVEADMFVMYGSWVGRVESVENSIEVMLRSRNGALTALCEIDPLVEELEFFVPGVEGIDVMCAYHPGCHVRAPLRVWKDFGQWKTRPIPHRKMASFPPAIVHKVRSVAHVQWLALNPMYAELGAANRPPETIDACLLTRLSRAGDMVGDFALCPQSVLEQAEGAEHPVELGVGHEEVETEPMPTATDAAPLAPGRWSAMLRSLRNRMYGPTEADTEGLCEERDAASGSEKEKDDEHEDYGIDPLVLVRLHMMRSRVKVRWQGGTTEEDIPGTGLVPVKLDGANEFQPGDLVRREEGRTSGTHVESGYVEKFDPLSRMVHVRWDTSSSTPDAKSTIESAYDVALDEQYQQVILGDLVVVTDPQKYASGGDRWVGTIADLWGTSALVQWNGSAGSSQFRDMVPLSELIHLEAMGEEGGEDEDGDETDDGTDMDLENGEVHVPRVYFDESTGITTTMLVPAASEDAGHVASPELAMSLSDADSLVGSSGSSSVSKSSACGTEDNIRNQPLLSPQLRRPDSDTGEPEGSDTVDTPFANFELVEHLPNHHFEAQSNVVSADFTSPGFVQRVQKEWNLLASSLPRCGIHVRAAETRLDILRAAIVGPEDTPYEDVVFLFDILLPAEYPTAPPKVWFHSHGRRLNPNLYADGKVCLSILNTWDGDGVEKWDAKTSNLLRVLLSLQGLVFNAQPYFNEAGYERMNETIEGQMNSRFYNERTLLLSLRHVLSQLENGAQAVPLDFAGFVRQHYARVGRAILQRMERSVSNQEPCASGSAAELGSVPEPNAFVLSVSRLLPRLRALVENRGEEEA